MFESQQNGLTPEQKEMLDDYCKTYRFDGVDIDPMKKWWVDENGLVNVEGDFVVNSTNHKYQGWRGLLGIKFGNVKGNFDIDGAGLEDAADLPRVIGGNLDADNNKFRTLGGIGMVKGTISLKGNLLISLEGMTEDLMRDFTPDSKFTMLSENLVRGAFLRDDLEEVLSGDSTWTSIYLNIVAGEYLIKDEDESIVWILKNKLNPEELGEEIRKAPEEMAIELAKVPAKHRKMLNDILDRIKDLPPGFREDKDLLSSLGDVGL